MPTAKPQARRFRTGTDAFLHLTRAMAHRHGVDLAMALHQGLLDRSDFSVMMQACRDCPGGPDDCPSAAVDAIDARAPDWCANRPVIEGLRDLL